MEKLKFNILIDATPEKVWNILWAEETYRKWTAAFSEGSYTETDWRQGGKILFLDGKKQGIVSRIAVIKPNEYMSFEHLGEIKDGIEDTTSEKVKQWAGLYENYTLKKINGKTELCIDLDTWADYNDMFSELWPRALKSIKCLSEG